MFEETVHSLHAIFSDKKKKQVNSEDFKLGMEGDRHMMRKKFVEWNSKSNSSIKKVVLVLYMIDISHKIYLEVIE